MSFEDYVSQITQKYRLAVAIAIIKTKPTDKSIDQYIQELKISIGDDKMEIDDLDVTICSDDFNLGNDDETSIVNNGRAVDDNHNTQLTNDSVNLLQEIDFDDFCGNEFRISSQHFGLDELRDVEGGRVDEVEITQSQVNNISPTTYCEGLKTQELSKNVLNSDKDNTYAQSIDFDVFNNINDSQNDPKRKTVKKIITKVTEPDVNLFDSQATNMYNIYGLTDNCTHYSQSQMIDDINIPNNYIFTTDIDKKYKENVGSNGLLTKNNLDEFETIENEIYSQCGQNMDTYLNENQLINTNDIDVDDTIQDEKEIETAILFKKDEQNNEELGPTQGIVCINGKRYVEIVNTTQERDGNIDTDTATNEVDNETVIQEDMTDSKREIVPFKVIEELNKVKGYLNRRVERRSSYDGYSTESGYRSEGQAKSSHKSALQLSGTWLNQSGHCLFNYITCCHLAVTTQDITNEISVTLGRLVDKLHEEEKYLSFLEELLETVEKILQQIYNEDMYENVLLKKDEQIQRIFLLNKSIHIQKYTIDKIATLLENLHPELLQSDSVYEIKNVNKLENVCYIFHVLEIILIKYTKNKCVSSQNSSQPSQEDERSLTRSSISDIWRKKWNPNYKETPTDSNVEKKCVLLKCSEVLNRIIVGCIDGYSLLAYSALKCFNVLQS